MSIERPIVLTKPVRSLRSEFRKSASSIDTHFYANGGSDDWDYYGRPFSEYINWFGPNVPNFIDKIQNTQDPVVVDLMSPTDALAENFETHPSLNKLGIAVSLTDTRDEAKKRRDEARNVHLVTGDLSFGNTWRQIQKILGLRKADVVVERAYGALDLVPEHPSYYAMAISRAWSMLTANDGLLIVQTFPLSSMKYIGVSVDDWVTKLRNVGIDANWQDNCKNTGTTNGVLSLIKKPCDPVKIPLL